ncbi:MAG: F0F1 ATP synthase subunit C [Alphaproteobacteria bacterium]|nr:F0F1 ATP synthase subunit C [Alphaproteobacteria bacterium]HCQ71027.1 F0F1 ATP synthase subunit C [Rhodospirillaceae bacterium]|tara:strand:+ start:24251 stop:24475 length:225 start_codon:yes stop_codon:yes gene_type:complete
MEIDAVKLIAAALALVPMFGVALAMGNIFSSYNDAVGRNPTSAEVLDKKFFISAALTEALALLAFAISAFILVG